MGLFGSIKSAAGAAVGGPLHFETSASRTIEGERSDVFEAGIRLDSLPRKVGNLALDVSHLEHEELRRADYIKAAVDVSSLDMLAEALKMRLRTPEAVLNADMTIAELDESRISLGGNIPNLGSCSLAIVLDELERQTTAHVSIGIDIEQLDIRIAAATQRTGITNLLAKSTQEFIDAYTTNIDTNLKRNIVLPEGA